MLIAFAPYAIMTIFMVIAMFEPSPLGWAVVVAVSCAVCAILAWLIHRCEKGRRPRRDDLYYDIWDQGY